MYGTRPDYAMSKETYHRFIATAKRLNMRVVGHTPRGLPFQSVLDEGQSSVDHAEEIYYVYTPILEKLGPVADFQFGKLSLEEYRKSNPKFPDLEKEILPLVKQLAKDTKRSDIVLSPGLITYKKIWRQITPQYSGMLKDPKMQYMYPLWRLWVSPGFNSYRGRWSDRLEEMAPVIKNTFEIQKLIVNEFNIAGIPIMAGTDATNPFVIEGFSLHEELKALVAAGLTPYEALKSATITPARFLNLEMEIGTVAVGKKADLVLIDGNPLESIGNTNRISGVSIAGTWHSKADLEKSLENLVDSYKPFWNAIEGSRDYFSSGDVKSALEIYAQLDNKTEEIAGYFRTTVNRRGYQLIRQKKLEAARKVFELNAKHFPMSANVWDSLAEIYMLLGNKTLAIKYYEKSLKLNPNNSNAVEQLKLLRSK